MPETSDHVKVLYICGTRRCGSTLLSRLLGEVDGFVNVGEMASYFLRQPLAGPCGCGASVDDCRFWRNFPISADVQALGRELIRTRRLPGMLLASRDRSRKIQTFLQHAHRLYRQLRQHTGAAVIVDSSKSPAMAHMLAQCAGLELSVIHLIRDPAGVVASRRQAKAYLRSAPASQVLLEWWAYNLAAEFLPGRSERYWRVDYEDLVRAPQSWVERISSAVAGQDRDCSFIAGDRARVGVQHILGGNPDKLTGLDIHIQQHHPRLPAWIAGSVYLLAAPLLLRYRWGGKRDELSRDRGLVRPAGESPAVEL